MLRFIKSMYLCVIVGSKIYYYIIIIIKCNTWIIIELINDY